jgi:CshA-type fibril repeat protein
VSGEGTYTVNPDGTVTFDPLPSFTGTATPVTYQATDVLRRTDDATITPRVTAPPPPLANPDTVSLIAGGTADFDNIFGTDALARKQTGGPELDPTTVCLIDPETSVCDLDNVVTIAGQGTFTLDPSTGVVTYSALVSATEGAKTAVTYKITDVLGVSVTSTLTPTIYPKPSALPDTSVGVMGATQILSPFGNDSPGSLSHPLVRTSIKLCDADESAPNCTETSVVVDGEGTYTVNANGTVDFEPLASFEGTATPLPYTVTDSLGQEATSTLRPRVVPPPAPITTVDRGTAEQGSTVVLSPWVNDEPGVVPDGVEGEVALVPTSIRLCRTTDSAPNCTQTSLTTDDGTYTVDTATGQVTFTHREGFIGTVTQPVTYIIKNDWTGESGIGVATSLLIPTITAPPPPTTTTTAPSSGGQAPPPTLAPQVGPELPCATDDTKTSEWDTVQIYAPLLNDIFRAIEPNLATLRLCGTGESPYICSQTTLIIPNEGTYTVRADGTIIFDPIPSFSGTATPVTYQVADLLGRFVHALITPVVLPPEEIARVFDQSTLTDPATPVWLEPTHRGVPTPGAAFVESSLRFVINNAQVDQKSITTIEGTWEIVGGRVKFLPRENFIGTAQIRFSITDTRGATLIGFLTVVVEDPQTVPPTGLDPMFPLLLSVALVTLGVLLRAIARKYVTNIRAMAMFLVASSVVVASLCYADQSRALVTSLDLQYQAMSFQPEADLVSSSSQLGPGFIRKYENVASINGVAIDALVSIVSQGGNVGNELDTFDEYDNSKHLSAHTKPSGTAESFGKLKIEFIENGTSTPVIIKNVRASIADIDAHEFGAFYGISSYRLSAGSQLSLSGSTSSGVYRFHSTTTGQSNTDEKRIAEVVYDATSSITTAFGCRTNANTVVGPGGKCGFTVVIGTITRTIDVIETPVARTPFTITYNANSGSSGTIPTPTTGTDALIVAGNAGGLASSSGSFVGWNTQPNGTGVSFPPSTTFIPTENITLYAQYGVSSSTSSTSSSTSSTSSSITPPTPQCRA